MGQSGHKQFWVGWLDYWEMTDGTSIRLRRGREDQLQECGSTVWPARYNRTVQLCAVRCGPVSGRSDSRLSPVCPYNDQPAGGHTSPHLAQYRAASLRSNYWMRTSESVTAGIKHTCQLVDTKVACSGPADPGQTSSSSQQLSCQILPIFALC